VRVRFEATSPTTAISSYSTALIAADAVIGVDFAEYHAIQERDLKRMSAVRQVKKYR
jgi:hypothetical protein